MTGCIFILLLVVHSLQSSEVYIPCTPTPTGEVCPVGYYCCELYGCLKDGTKCPIEPANSTMKELLLCETGICPPNFSCCENKCCPSNCTCGCLGCWCQQQDQFGPGPVCPVNAPSCPVLKTVGDTCYERIEYDVDTSSHGCTANCTYKKLQLDGPDDERFCFAPGLLTVDNHKCKNPETYETEVVIPNWCYPGMCSANKTCPVDLVCCLYNSTYYCCRGGECPATQADAISKVPGAQATIGSGNTADMFIYDFVGNKKNDYPINGTVFTSCNTSISYAVNVTGDNNLHKTILHIPWTCLIMKITASYQTSPDSSPSYCAPYISYSPNGTNYYSYGVFNDARSPKNCSIIEWTH